jgi:hypothetical protein
VTPGVTITSTETMESCLQQLATQVSLQMPSDGVAVSRAVHAMSKSLSVLSAAGSQHSAQNVVSLTVDAIGKIAVQYVNGGGARFCGSRFWLPAVL